MPLAAPAAELVPNGMLHTPLDPIGAAKRETLMTGQLRVSISTIQVCVLQRSLQSHYFQCRHNMGGLQIRAISPTSIGIEEDGRRWETPLLFTGQLLPVSSQASYMQVLTCQNLPAFMHFIATPDVAAPPQIDNSAQDLSCEMPAMCVTCNNTPH